MLCGLQRLLAAFIVLFVFMIASGAVSARETATADHVRVDYDGIDAAHAQAIAKTVSGARRVYIDLFKFDMPDTIHVKVDCGPDLPSHLFTDGKDRVFLSLPSADKLAPPRQSGTFIIYGLCHEVGHIAMYRMLKDRDWMTTAAAEGWAHYAGSVVVDHVFDKEGKELWPAPYIYRADGTARLRQQLARRNATITTRGAGQWQRLAAIIGQDAFPKLFAAWQAAKIDPTDPSATLLASAIGLQPDGRAKIEAWWRDTAPLFVAPRQASDLKAESIDADKLTGKPTTLAGDDGQADGKRSIAGGGHARLFESPGQNLYLTAVSFYGARYGAPQAPDEDFDIALCDEKLRPIATWKKPYSAAPRGQMGWIKLNIPPTRVPPRFHICLVFRPTATKGVFVGYDNSTKGHSLAGTPGKPGKEMADSDWMIRVELDQLKDADALGEGK